MKKCFLILLIFVVITACCTDDTPDPTWNPPQPIDERLLGSWSCDWKFGDGHTIVTFSENNECYIKYEREEDSYKLEEFRNWYVVGDTLVLPGSYDYRMMRFPAYEYSLQNNELLHIDLIIYPFVGCGEFTAEGYLGPLGNMTPLTYKKIEE